MTAVDVAVVGLAGSVLVSQVRRLAAAHRAPGWTEILAGSAALWLALFHLVDLLSRWALPPRAAERALELLHLEFAWSVGLAAALALWVTSRGDEVARRRRLEAVSWRLMECSEAQGGRVARLLHDGASQKMTAVKLELEALRQGANGALAPRIAETVELVDDSIESLRGLARELRPPMLDDLGLAAALRTEASRLVEGSALEASFRGFDSLPRASTEVETACFRIALEAVANVVQHSGARTLSIELSGEGDRIGLVIDDDGAGFDLERTLGGREVEPPFGLWLMQERATLALGDLVIESRLGEGTRVSASFPRAANGNVVGELLV